MKDTIKADLIIISLAIFILSASFAFFYLYEKKAPLVSVTKSAKGPQVLGASADIRGLKLEPASLPGLLQTKPLSLGGITASGWLVYDSATRQILSEKNQNERLPIASLTKIITGLVAYDNLDMNSSLTIGTRDLVSVAPILGLAVREKIKAQDLFDAMLIGSANDAALSLANHTEQATGRKFTELMNKKAEALGMANSHFGNPMGFDYGNNYSTASDLSLAINASQQLAIFTNLGRRLYKDFSSESGKSYKINSTNKLIKIYPELEAIKTGFTENSGGSLVVKVNFNERGIIYIILGSKSREKDFEILKNQIEQSYVLEEQG